MEVLDTHHINNRPADITEPTSLKKSEKHLNSTKIIKTSQADDEGYSPRITLMSTPLSKEDLNSKEMSVDIEAVSKSLDELSIQSEIISTKFSEGIKFNDLIKEVKVFVFLPKFTRFTSIYRADFNQDTRKLSLSSPTNVPLLLLKSNLLMKAHH